MKKLLMLAALAGLVVPSTFTVKAFAADEPPKQEQKTEKKKTNKKAKKEVKKEEKKEEKK
jgi:ribosomal protein L12E/L44/L45/RPP1/RPP2